MINETSHIIIATGKRNVWQCLDFLIFETKMYHNLQGYEYHQSSVYQLGVEYFSFHLMAFICMKL